VTGKGKNRNSRRMGHFLRRLLARYVYGHLPFNSGFDPGPAYSGSFLAANPLTRRDFSAARSIHTAVYAAARR